MEDAIRAARADGVASGTWRSQAAHFRFAERRGGVLVAVPGGTGCVIASLTDIDESQNLADADEYDELEREKAGPEMGTARVDLSDEAAAVHTAAPAAPCDHAMLANAVTGAGDETRKPCDTLRLARAVSGGTAMDSKPSLSTRAQPVRPAPHSTTRMLERQVAKLHIQACQKRSVLVERDALPNRSVLESSLLTTVFAGEDRTLVTTWWRSFNGDFVDTASSRTGRAGRTNYHVVFSGRYLYYVGVEDTSPVPVPGASAKSEAAGAAAADVGFWRTVVVGGGNLLAADRRDERVAGPGAPPRLATDWSRSYGSLFHVLEVTWRLHMGVLGGGDAARCVPSTRTTFFFIPDAVLNEPTRKERRAARTAAAAAAVGAPPSEGEPGPPAAPVPSDPAAARAQPPAAGLAGSHVADAVASTGVIRGLKQAEVLNSKSWDERKAAWAAGRLHVAAADRNVTLVEVSVAMAANGRVLRRVGAGAYTHSADAVEPIAAAAPHPVACGPERGEPAAVLAASGSPEPAYYSATPLPALAPPPAEADEGVVSTAVNRSELIAALHAALLRTALPPDAAAGLSGLMRWPDTPEEAARTDNKKKNKNKFNTWMLELPLPAAPKGAAALRLRHDVRYPTHFVLTIDLPVQHRRRAPVFSVTETATLGFGLASFLPPHSRENPYGFNPEGPLAPLICPLGPSTARTSDTATADAATAAAEPVRPVSALGAHHALTCPWDPKGPRWFLPAAPGLSDRTVLNFCTLHACDSAPLAVRVQKQLVLQRTTVAVFAHDSAATVQQDSMGLSLPYEYEASAALGPTTSPPASIVERSWSDSSTASLATPETGAGAGRLGAFLGPVMGLDPVPDDDTFYARCVQLLSPAVRKRHGTAHEDVIVPESYLLFGHEDATAAGDKPASKAAAAPRRLRLQPTYYGGYVVQRGLYEGRRNLRQAGRFVARFPVLPTGTASSSTPPLAAAAASPPCCSPATVSEPAVLLRPAVLSPAQVHERLYLDGGEALRLGRYFETKCLLSATPADASAGAGVGVGAGAGAIASAEPSEHRHPTALHTLAAMLQPHNPVCAVEIGASETEELLLEALGQPAEPGSKVSVDLTQHTQAVKSFYTPLARACSLQKGCLVESLMRLYLHRHSGQACDSDCIGAAGAGGFNAWLIVGHGAAEASKNAQTAFLSAVNEWEGEFNCAWLLLAVGYVPSSVEIKALGERLAGHAGMMSSAVRLAALRDFCLQLRDFLVAKARLLDPGGKPAAGAGKPSPPDPPSVPTLEWRRNDAGPGVGGGGSTAAE